MVRNVNSVFLSSYIDTSNVYIIYKPTSNTIDVKYIPYDTLAFIDSYNMGSGDMSTIMQYKYGRRIRAYKYRWYDGREVIFMESSNGIYRYYDKWTEVNQCMDKKIKLGKMWNYSIDTYAYITGIYMRYIADQEYLCVEVSTRGLGGGEVYVWAIGFGLMSYSRQLCVDDSSRVVQLPFGDAHSRLVDVIYCLDKYVIKPNI
jgi:hypothetical protein